MSLVLSGQMQGLVGVIRTAKYLTKVEYSIETTWPINERRNIRGILMNADDEKVTVVTQEGKEFLVPIEAIKNAKLDLDIDPNLSTKN